MPSRSGDRGSIHLCVERRRARSTWRQDFLLETYSGCCGRPTPWTTGGRRYRTSGRAGVTSMLVLPSARRRRQQRLGVVAQLHDPGQIQHVADRPDPARDSRRRIFCPLEGSTGAVAVHDAKWPRSGQPGNVADVGKVRTGRRLTRASTSRHVIALDSAQARIAAVTCWSGNLCVLQLRRAERGDLFVWYSSLLARSAEPRVAVGPEARVSRCQQVISCRNWARLPICPVRPSGLP